MKKFAFAITLCILGISTAYALDERETYCASAANHKNLVGKERDKFIAQCTLQSPAEKAKLEKCAMAANQQNLMGKSREKFVLECMMK